MQIRALVLSLVLASSAMAETIVVPVQDLLFEIPQFNGAPQFGLNEALNGSWTPENPKKTDRKTKREQERKLINMLWDVYPDAESIRIWNGNAIIRLPEDTNADNP
jgi:hypothetical protein